MRGLLGGVVGVGTKGMVAQVPGTRVWFLLAQNRL